MAAVRLAEDATVAVEARAEVRADLGGTARAAARVSSLPLVVADTTLRCRQKPSFDALCFGH